MPLMPDKVAPGSARKVWWRCPKGHEYRSRVGHRVASGVGCAQCSESKRLAKYYENMVAAKGSLASTFPEIGKEWHPIRNGELRPENFPPKSGIKVWWQCARGHHWKTAIANRTVGGTGCPYCRPQTSGLEIRVFTELQMLIPSALWREKVHAQEVDVYLPNYAIGIEVDGYPWHEHREGQDRRKTKVLSAQGIRLIRLRHEKLRPLNPGDLRFNDKSDQRALMMQLAAQLATLVDPATADTLHKYVQGGELIADEEWQRITSLLPGPQSGTSLSELHPEVAALWHPFRNGLLRPESFTVGSSRKVWWQCAKGHEWQAAIVSRAKGSGCPMCSGKRAHAGHNITITHPEVVRFWSDRNSVSVDRVAPGSHQVAWWRCDKGHEFDMPVKAFVRNGGCPFCSGKRVAPENTLAAAMPGIERYWKPSNELTPASMTRSTAKLIYLQCPDCGYEWDTSPNLLTRRPRPTKDTCPRCRKLHGVTTRSAS